MQRKVDLIRKIVDGKIKKMEEMKEMKYAKCQHRCRPVPCAGQCGV